MFKTIFQNINQEKLIIIENHTLCSKLTKLLPIFNENIQHISAENSLKPQTLSEEINKNSKIVVIESISPFLWTHGVLKVAQELKNLINTGIIIIIILLPDTLLNEHDSRKLRYLSTAYIEILRQTEPRKYLVKISTKKKCQSEILEIGANNEITSTACGQSDAEQSISTPIYSTFNLGVHLSETEKQARKSLVLPYLRNKQKSGAIIYNADEADLEEDPDEDLEL